MEKVIYRRSRRNPKTILSTIRLTETEYQLIKKHFGGLAGLRIYGMELIKKVEAEGGVIEKHFN